MRTTRTRVPAGFALAGLLAAFWFFLAPPQLGGSTSFTATVGNSMEPMFHKGDLAVTRRASAYRVGDVVLYESPVFHRPVLHRIIVVQGGKYFFQGDNNDFVDPGYVTRDALLGKLWYRVPHAGMALNWFGKPSHAALLAALVVMGMALAGANRVQRRRGRRRSAKERAPVVKRALFAHLHRPRKTVENIVGGIAALLAVVLLVVGFTSPLKRAVQVPDAYRHSGSFSYTARVLKPVSTYPTGVAHAGEPLFLSNFTKMDVGFVYGFASRRPHAVHGTIALKAVITSDTNWHRSFVLTRPTAFEGDRAKIHGIVDLRGLRDLMAQLAVESGSVGAQYKLDLRPVVRVHGLVGTKPVTETFSPVLATTLTESTLKLDVVAPATPPGATYAPPSPQDLLEATLNPSRPGTVPGFAPAYVSIARFKLATSTMRGLGLGLFALALLVLFTKPFRRKREVWSHERRIAFRYECVIVDVVSVANGGTSSGAPTEIPDFESLATLARYCERPILRETHDGAHVYAVEDGGRLYVHRPALRPAPAPAVEPPTKPIAPPPPVRGGSPPRRNRTLLGSAATIAVLVLGVTFATAFTAANTVPATRAGVSTQARTLAQLAPSQCAGLTLTNLIVASTAGTSGSSANDLIIGPSAAATISLKGGAGNDCIVGGGGSSTVNKFDGGTDGGDICIGGHGASNTFKGCSATY